MLCRPRRTAIRSVLLAVLAAFPLFARAAQAQAAPDDAFAREYKAIQTLRTTQAPKELPHLSNPHLDWMQVRNAEIHDRGMVLLN
ncbi:MAG TPA: hypothetical protein VGE76_23475, partial [Opitutaceae bacterium]